MKDPKAEQLVSQVSSAISAASPGIIPVNELNLAAGNVNKLQSALELIAALQQSNAQLQLQLETAERLIGRRLLEMAQREEQTQKKQEMAIARLAEENSSLRHQMDELALKAEAWAIRAQDAEAKLERLSEQQSESFAIEVD
jgi:hypothetical protein